MEKVPESRKRSVRFSVAAAQSPQSLRETEWLHFSKEHLLVDYVGAVLLQRSMPNAKFASFALTLIVKFLSALKKRKFTSTMLLLMHSRRVIKTSISKYIIKRRMTISKLLAQISHSGMKRAELARLKASMIKVYRVALHATIADWQNASDVGCHTNKRRGTNDDVVSLLSSMTPLTQQYKDAFLNSHNLRAFSSACRAATGHNPRRETPILRISFSHRLDLVYAVSSRYSCLPCSASSTFGLYYAGFKECVEKGVDVPDNLPIPVTPPGTPKNKNTIFKQLITSDTETGRVRLISYATRKRYVGSFTATPPEVEKVRPQSRLLTATGDVSKPSSATNQTKKDSRQLSLKVVNGTDQSEPQQQMQLTATTLSNATEVVLRYSPMPPVVPRRRKKIVVTPSPVPCRGMQCSLDSREAAAADEEIQRTLCTWRSAHRGNVIKSPSPFDSIEGYAPTPLPVGCIAASECVTPSSSSLVDDVVEYQPRFMKRPTQKVAAPVRKYSPTGWLSRKVIKHNPNRAGSHIVSTPCRRMRTRNVPPREATTIPEDEAPFTLNKKAVIHSKPPSVGLRVKSRQRRVFAATTEDTWKQLSEVTGVSELYQTADQNTDCSVSSSSATVSNSQSHQRSSSFHSSVICSSPTIDIDIDIDPNANTNTNTYDVNADVADTNTNTDADIGVDADADTNVNADADVNVSDANTNADVDADVGVDADADADAVVDADADADADADVNVSDANTNADVNVGVNAVIDAGADADVNAADANADAEADIEGSLKDLSISLPPHSSIDPPVIPDEC
eukprot:TRINITY_DN9500_c0_g1_i1.p1 TRINITY_DN9500_c0_g1~~TRINITY_DN9500_c0_g1_i1.p1  ORF type:complete len:794 (+),score=153.92 TRINITY_DN9500_c0_g1_i1:72-2453(+)